MVAKKLKVIEIKRSEYTAFKKRAEDLYLGMVNAERAALWSTVGLTAVHCAISMSDALTVHYLGKRSSGDDHFQAKDLLGRIPVETARNYLVALSKIIAKKNAVASDGREFTRNEAIDIFKQAERFYQWGIKNLPS